MTIAELIAYVGSDNIQFQNLEHDVLGCTSNSVTFITDCQKAAELMVSAVDGPPPSSLGIVLWIPRDLMPKELQ